MDDQFLQLENKYLAEIYQKNAQIIDLINRVKSMEAQLQDTFAKNAEYIKTISELEQRISNLTLPKLAEIDSAIEVKTDEIKEIQFQIEDELQEFDNDLL